MAFYIDVILPIPLKQNFTYEVNELEFNYLRNGMRVIVPFGKSKSYTGIVCKIHQQKPVYETKEIYQIIESQPIINDRQFVLFNWIAKYYMTSLGEVIKTALPKYFLLESETIIEKSSEIIDFQSFTDEEYLIYDALTRSSSLSIEEIGKILKKKNVIKYIQNLVEKKAIRLTEKVFEKYNPKLVRYIRLHPNFEHPENLKNLFASIPEKASAQKKLLLTYFSLKTENQSLIKVSDLLLRAESTSSALAKLIEKGIFQEYFQQTDRISFFSDNQEFNTLSEKQSTALKKIKTGFQENSVILLHGVAASGKTEIYIQLIENEIHTGKQILFLIPEISLSVQLIERLKHHFGEKMSIFHNKYSGNERVEVWNNLLNISSKTQIIIGVQSAVYLPFSNLGLIVIDEEQDASYKQNEIAPRIQTRDVALVLAKEHQAKVLLGTATPSAESYYNVQKGKYGYVQLNERYKNVQLPEIQLIDLKDKTKRKQLQGHFSDTLLNEIQRSLDDRKQIILFQNRRGYAPYLQCGTCNTIPTCPNCDVSLTYHQLQKQLRCHYCGHSQAIPNACPACGNSHLEMKGAGTEQIEEELNVFFPNAKIERMDKDSTRGKHGMEKIIHRFENQEIDILVGTQMVGKGLDFENVNLVGILNADISINQPDFRAVERSFQLLTQIATRAGRHHSQGKVLVQTYNPYQSVLQQITDFSYEKMIKEQLTERENFHYAPFYRLIRVTFKHKNLEQINEASAWFGEALRLGLRHTQVEILGPEFPNISRIRNEYIKHILLKIPQNFTISKLKEYILKIEQSFFSIGKFRSVYLSYNVDI